MFDNMMGVGNHYDLHLNKQQLFRAGSSQSHYTDLMEEICITGWVVLTIFDQTNIADIVNLNFFRGGRYKIKIKIVLISTHSLNLGQNLLILSSYTYTPFLHANNPSTSLLPVQQR